MRRYRLGLTGLLLCGSALGAFAQGGPPGGPPPEVARAQAFMRAGQPDSAIATLEAFFRQTPSAVAGRLILGNAHKQKGDFDRALAAYEAVAQPRPIRLQARFQIAAIHARRGNADEAFRVLKDLKATGGFDMDLVRTSEDFAALRNDARFGGVMFQPADFEHPFVERVRIIHEWVAESKGDQFSWIARGIGDVDGDGASDVATSAPTHGANGQPAGPGRVYVYSGRSGKLLWAQTGQAGASLGIGIEGAGDVNRDGVNDVIAGAPGVNRAYVFSGTDGAVLLTLAAADSNLGFGMSAAGAGDQNGDGHADLLVGAPSSSVTGEGAGGVYLFSGKDGQVLERLDGERAGDAFGSIVAGLKHGVRTAFSVGAPGAGPSQRGRVYVYAGPGRAPKFIIEADESGAALGAMFTSIVGDVDGDRVPDVYASDFANAASGPATGRIYVHSGATGKQLLRLTGVLAGDGFGIGSAEAGDVNRDGYDDLVLGAWQYPGAAQSGGKIYVFSGKDGALLRTITGRVPGETLGFDATGIGDVDGDGKVDLLVTSSWSNIKGFQSGRMFVVAGE